MVVRSSSDMALLNSTLCAPNSAAKTEYATGSSRCHTRGTCPAALRDEHGETCITSLTLSKHVAELCGSILPK